MWIKVILLLELLPTNIFGYVRDDSPMAYMLQQTPNLGKSVGELTILNEISKFLTDAREKLESDCTTIIWDYSFSTVLDNLKICGDVDFYQACTPVYTVFYEDGGNMTEAMISTLKEGYRRQCGSYIMILESWTAVVDLLHQGDYHRLMNTRGRFLIWYEILDKVFEADDIWKKVPNAILFHTKIGSRSRRRITFTIKGFKWPVLPNVPEATRVIDFWSQGKYFGRSLESWYRDKTTDLRNSTLRILAVDHPPGVIKYVMPNGLVEYAGSEVEIVKELSSIMNFQYEFLEVDTYSSGPVGGNTTPSFYVAVGRLIYGDADLAIGSFFVLKHYLDSLDMSIPLDVACTSFLVPNPLTRPRYLALILPFTFKLWILVILICFIFAPVCLYLLCKIPIHHSEYDIFTGRSQVVFTCFSIMTQVALHVWPRFWSIRMFIGWFWIFCLLITLAYRGAMVSFLSIPLFEKSIDNIQDLKESGLKLGGWGSELHRLFKQYTATNGQSRTKIALRDRYQLVDDVNAAISQVAEREFALYENIRYLKFIRQTRNLSRLGSPSMRVMKQCIVPVHVAIAYQKNSPIVPTIDRHIRRFQESGLMKRWSARLVARTKQHYQKLAEHKVQGFGTHDNPQGSENDEENQEEEEDQADAASGNSNKQRKQRVLNIRDLQGSIYLIIFGCFLSVFAFIVELCVANYGHTVEHVKNINITNVKGLVDSKIGKVGMSKFKIKHVETNRFVLSKQQMLEYMIMEFDKYVEHRAYEERLSRLQLIEKKFTHRSLKRLRREGVRVRTSDNREQYFTYLH